MHIQEREEIEFVDGYPNELARIHAQVRSETKLSRASRTYINRLSALGFYVVIQHNEKFCVWTDALLGLESEIVKITRCSEEVDALNQYPEIEVVYPEMEGGSYGE